ncbi:MAG: efflux RND transporter periplasmic adaptor subunit [Betaproteobacteria bacterium]|nr:efflux RND transporter periplasmic adaptor subunit [Betaproteobacteria bacterium]
MPSLIFGNAVSGIKRWWWLLVVLLIATAAVLWVNRPRAVTVDVLIAQHEDVQTSVVASGRVLAPSRVDIGATITARVQHVAVREGARVAEGELLVRLEQGELAAALAQARAARDRARSRVDSVAKLALPTAREAQTQAELNANIAEREYQRARELLAQGFISQSRVDEAERQMQIARSQLASAKTQVAAQSAPGAEAQQARQQLAEAEAAVQVAQARLAQSEIRAPAAGVVLERTIEPGDIAQPAKRMMTLALDGPTRLIVQVDEKNLPLLTLGRGATAAADAFPNERFEALIAYISPGVDAARGTVELRLDIPNPPAFLKSDMTVSIDAPGPVIKQAVIVPAEAIRQLQSEAPFVLLARVGVAARVPVRTGMQTQGRVHVVQGVSAGDAVILTREVQADARVKTRRK